MSLKFALLPCVALFLAFQLPNDQLSAQEWADKMFGERRHDFGAVAKNSKAEFSFEFENPYEEEIHIASVRTSCGCVSAEIVNSNVETWGKGTILAKLNTRAYLGQRSATITVVIDRPYRAEVQLGVAGFIRQDVELSPGTIRFGNVNHGEEAQTSLNIRHQGDRNWQIVDVRSGNPHLGVSLTELQRTASQVNYQMNVRLKEDAPVGALADEITLVTNDREHELVTVAVEANVAAALTISPRILNFGELVIGERTTLKLIMRGRESFTIEDIRSESPQLEARINANTTTLQMIPLTFVAGEEAGSMEGDINVITSIGSVRVPFRAEVVER